MTWEYKGGIVGGHRTADDFVTSANEFATAADFETTLLKTKIVYVAAAGNDLAIRLLGSYDGGANYPATVQGSVTVANGSGTAIAVSGYYTNLRLQVGPNSAGQHGTASAVLAGASF